MAQTIWLVGMMGAGKSAVGKALAARLGVDFSDVDAEIERIAAQGIPEIFASEGEAGFRARERSVIESLAGKPLVVALGGGAIAQPDRAMTLAASGTVIYLRTRVETLVSRIGCAEQRPLLAGLDAEGRLRRLSSLLADRREAYETASLAIDTDDRGVEALAAELAARLEGAS